MEFLAFAIKREGLQVIICIFAPCLVWDNWRPDLVDQMSISFSYPYFLVSFTMQFPSVWLLFRKYLWSVFGVGYQKTGSITWVGRSHKGKCETFSTAKVKLGQKYFQTSYFCFLNVYIVPSILFVWWNSMENLIELISHPAASVWSSVLGLIILK